MDEQYLTYFVYTSLAIFSFAYIAGSIPFGLLLTRAAGLGDIRAIGSGNIGATNVMRTGRKWLGITTLLLDAGKGFLPLWFLKSQGLEEAWCYAVGLTAVLGHVFPVWLKFKGGKGVATAIGVLFALDALFGIAVCAGWLAVFSLTRYVSAASIAAFWLAMLVPVLQGDADGLYFSALLALLVTWTHRANIQRLRAGTEHRFRKGDAS